MQRNTIIASATENFENEVIKSLQTPISQVGRLAKSLRKSLKDSSDQVSGSEIKSVINKYFIKDHKLSLPNIVSALVLFELLVKFSQACHCAIYRLHIKGFTLEIFQKAVMGMEGSLKIKMKDDTKPFKLTLYHNGSRLTNYSGKRSTESKKEGIKLSIEKTNTNQSSAPKPPSLKPKIHQVVYNSQGEPQKQKKVEKHTHNLLIKVVPVVLSHRDYLNTLKPGDPERERYSDTYPYRQSLNHPLKNRCYEVSQSSKNQYVQLRKSENLEQTNSSAKRTAIMVNSTSNNSHPINQQVVHNIPAQQYLYVPPAPYKTISYAEGTYNVPQEPYVQFNTTLAQSSIPTYPIVNNAQPQSFSIDNTSPYSGFYQLKPLIDNEDLSDEYYYNDYQSEEEYYSANLVQAEETNQFMREQVVPASLYNKSNPLGLFSVNHATYKPSLQNEKGVSDRNSNFPSKHF